MKMKKAPKPISNLAQAPVIGHSGGSSDRSSHPRVGAKYQPRPRLSKKMEPEPHGLEMPAVIKHSGGPTDMPKPRTEGMNNRPLNTMFHPEDRSEPNPMGLSQPDPVKHSDHTIRTKSLGAKPLKWNKRGYKMPTPVEALGE